MYCVNCGVKLADTEQRCPLCQTRVFHPDIERPAAAPLYPADRYPTARKRSLLPHIVVTVMVVLVIGMLVMCDYQFDHRIAWAHYAAGGTVILYAATVLPLWFKKPHPVILVPCVFALTAAYLLMINLCTGGSWFLSFAFPVTGGVGGIVTAAVTLLVTLRRGKLFVIGGSVAALGSFMLPVEWLLTITFDVAYIGWSWYPLTACVVIGGLLIFLGICRPVRDTMERKFFI